MKFNLTKNNLKILRKKFLLKILIRNRLFLDVIDVVKINLLLRKYYKNQKKVIPSKCFITNRNKGYFRFYGLSRFKVKQLADMGILPGITRSSW